MTKEDIALEIRDAFNDVAYPGDDRIVSVPLHEPEMVKAFVGKHWREILDPEFLEVWRYFPFFTYEGLLFYLPAYLLAAIEYSGRSAEWLAPLFCKLYPETDIFDIQDVRASQELVQMMTEGQRRAIRHFLEYLLATEGDTWVRYDEAPYNRIALMLANQWNQY